MININKTGEKTKIFIPRDKIDGKLNNDCDLSTKLEKLADILVNIENIKTDIKNAIENKNVEVGDISFNEYADKIDDISYINFECIGYNKQLSNELNSEINEPLLYSKQLYDEWDSSITSTGSLYKNDKQLVYAPNIDTSNVTYMGSMFYDCSTIKTIPQFNTSKVTDMGYMFRHCSSLQSIPLLDTSNVTNMNNMFNGCSKLTTIPLFDTSKVTNMSNMFYYCASLQSIPQLNTSKVTGMSNMFNGCSKLTTIPLFDTSKVTNMGSMFYSCSNLQSISLLDTSNVTNMDNMFYSCSKLQSISLLDCGNVTSMNRIFGTSNINTLTDLGGFKDLKILITSNFLDKAPNLTTESLMNVINNLFDLTANGLSGQSLKFGSTNINKLTAEQIAVATAKGWTLTA